MPSTPFTNSANQTFLQKSDARSFDLFARLVACVEVLAAFTMLIAFSGTKSLWLDEALTLVNVMDWKRMWIFIASQESGKFWLHHLPAYLLWHTGSSEFWFRSYSVFFATASVPLVIAIGNAIGGPRTGLVAGLLMAFQPNLVAHGQEVRMYAMLEFFTVLGTYLFIRGLREKSRLTWLAYGIVIAAAIATHLFAILSLASHLLVALPHLRDRAARRGLLIGTGAAAILTSASLIALGGAGLATTSRGATWLTTPTLRTLLGYAHFAAGQTLPWWTYCAMLVLVTIIISIMFVKQSYQRWPACIVFGALVVPVAVTFIFSVAIQSVFLNRYLIIAVPPFLLMVALLVGKLKQPFLVGIVAMALTIQPFQGVQREHSKVREDWRAATSHILAIAQRGDVVLALPEYAVAPIAIYQFLEVDDDLRQALALDFASADNVDTSDWRNSQHIWLIVSGYPGNISTESIITQLTAKRVAGDDALFSGIRVIRYDHKSH